MRNTRLDIVPYPRKTQWLEEAARTDCDSWAVFHIEIWHDALSTCELFSLLKHEFPPRHLRPTKKLAIFMLKHQLDWVTWVKVSDLELNERVRSTAWYGYQPQIDIWFSDTSRPMYDLWIQWCRAMLKRSARWSDGKGHVTNPFAELRFRLRVEFHD